MLWPVQALSGGREFGLSTALRSSESFRIVRSTIPNDGLAHLGARVSPHGAPRMSRPNVQKGHAE